MEVRHCPSCGSDDINKTTASFEYGGSTRWSCEDCSWRYKSGRGIGTGTSNSGTHPRDVNNENSIQTGEYCSNCETVIRGQHACTPLGVLRDSVEDTISQDEMREELGEFHFSPSDEIEEAIREKQITLTPTFYHVKEWPEDGEPALAEAVYEEIQNATEDGEGLKFGELTRRMAAENPAETKAIRQIVRYLERNGKIRDRGFRGYTPRD